MTAATRATGGDRRLELASGPLSYRDTGSGEPIVFVHGLLTDGSLWRNTATRLERDFRCLAPDWPMGSHSLPMRVGADLSPLGQARIVADFLETLDLTDVTLVGNDTGGGVCQHVVTKHPARVGRLVLTPCDAFENYLPLAFRHLKLSARVRPALYLAMQSLRLAPVRRSPLVYGWVAKRPIEDAVQRAWIAPVVGSGEIRRDVAKLLRGMNRADSIRASEGLGGFGRPTLVVWDRDDRFFPLEHAYRLREALPDCRLEIFDDCLSFLPEDQPERLADRIAAFLG